MISMPPLIASLPIYVPGKPIEAVAREYNLDPHGIAKLASNENPLGAPRPVREALGSLLDKLHIYPDGAAVDLRDRIAKEHGLDRSWVVVGNGSAEVIEMLAKGFLDDGDTTMYSQYAFSLYKIATLATNHVAQEIPAAPGFKHDLKGFLASITEHTKLIYIANPNNPTGSMLTSDELDEFVRQVPERILIAIDEAYFELVSNGQFPDSLKYLRDWGKKNVIVLRTFSKAYGLAALRMGYGMAHPDVCKGLEKVRSPFNTNMFSQLACTLALDCKEHIQASIDLVVAERAYLRKALAPLGIAIHGEEGNFLMLDLGRPGAPVFTELQRRGVIVRPLDGYGLPTCLRVSFGTRQENERFVKALKEVLGR